MSSFRTRDIDVSRKAVLITRHDSIFFYLMDPHGQFVDAFGKNSTAEDVTTKVMQAVER